MATSQAETEDQNYYRLVSLLIDKGTVVLRKLLMKHVLMQTTSPEQHLANHKVKLESLQKKNILSQNQMDMLFPQNGSPNLKTFDITLISCLLKNTCGKMPLQEWTEIENLRKTRNEVSGHSARAAISYSDFQLSWSKISQIINNLAKCSADQTFVQEIHDDINDLWLNPKLKPSSKLTDVLLQWYKSDQQVLEQMEEHRKEITSELLQVKREVRSEIVKQELHLKLELQRLEHVSDKQSEKLNAELEKVQEESRMDREMARQYQEAVGSDLKVHQSEISQMRKRTTDLEEVYSSVFKQGDHAFEKLLESSKQVLLANVDRPYVKTHLTEEVLKKLQKTGCCVISGKPGDGKTMTAVAILKEQFNLENCVILSFPQEWSTVNLGKTKAILIDDIFGKYRLDEGRLTEWLHVLDKVSAAVCLGKIKILIATRSNILKLCSAKLSTFQVFFEVVELSSESLLEEEKINILKATLQYNNRVVDENKIRLCVKQFESPIGFPLCCQLYATNASLFSNGEVFFKRPFKLFMGNLSTLAEGRSKSEEGDFADLVCLFCRGGKLLAKDLSDTNKKLCREMLDMYSTLGLSIDARPSVIKRCLDDMSGVYVTTSEEIYHFIHNTVFEAVGQLYGKRNPEYMIRTCSSDYLHQCTTTEHSDGPDASAKEDGLVITEHYYMELVKRLIREITVQREVVRTAANPSLRDEQFVRAFLQQIGQEGCKKAILDKIEVKGKWGSYSYFFLSKYTEIVCRWTPQKAEKLLSEFLKFIGKCKHSSAFLKRMCWKRKLLHDCLGRCCGYGNKDVCMLFLQYGAIPNVDTLMMAAAGGNIDIFRLIMDQGAAMGVDTLYAAMKGGNIDIVKLVMDHGVVPDTAALHWAVQVGDIDLVVCMLEQGAVSHSSKETLYWAVNGGNIEIVRYMIETGTVPDTSTLYCAVKGGNIDMVKLISEHTVPDTDTLYWAVKGGNIDIVRIILEHEVVPDTETLNMAVKKGDISTVKLILEHGAMQSPETSFWAAKGHNNDIVNLLVGYGAGQETKSIGQHRSSSWDDSGTVSGNQ